MSSLRSEPFLWIHLSGIALFPIFLEITWLALAIGNPASFAVLELLPIAIVGIIPVLWMQLVYPFDIFSILLVSLKPEKLTIQQRKILTLLKTKQQQWLSAIAAILMIFVLWLLARLAPLAIELVAFLPQWRVFGLAIASLAFLGSNLFLQVPLGVLSVLLSSESKLANIEPYQLETIEKSFTVPGIKVNKIFSFLQ
jgi:hypothetical protein